MKRKPPKFDEQTTSNKALRNYALEALELAKELDRQKIANGHRWVRHENGMFELKKP